MDAPKPGEWSNTIPSLNRVSPELGSASEREPTSTGTAATGRNFWNRSCYPSRLENNQFVFLDTGLLFECLGDFEKARVMYSQIAKPILSGTSPERLRMLETDIGAQLALVRLCLIDYRRGHLEETQQRLELLLETCPRFRLGWLALAKALLLRHKIPGAFAAYQRCMELDPESAKDPLVWTGIGILYQLYGQLEEAAEAYKVTQRLLPVNDEFRDVALFYLATLKCAARDYDAALALFTQALEYRVEERSAALLMTKKTRHSGNAVENDQPSTLRIGNETAPLSTANRRATSFTSDTSAARGNGPLLPSGSNNGRQRESAATKMVLGMAQKEYETLERQRLFRARRALLDLVLDEELSALSDGRTWCEIGHVYMLCQNLAEARKAFENALIADPGDVDALQQLSWTLILLNEVPIALEHLRRCVQLDPNRAHSWYLLGRAYALSEQHLEACNAYQQAVLREPNNASYWCSIGVLYYQAQQYSDAADAYMRAIRLNPGLAEVWFDLGILYENYGQFADACSAYHRAMSLNPHNISYLERYRAMCSTLQAGEAVTSAPGRSAPKTAGQAMLPSAPAAQGLSYPPDSRRQDTFPPLHRTYPAHAQIPAQVTSRRDAAYPETRTLGERAFSGQAPGVMGMVPTQPEPWAETLHRLDAGGGGGGGGGGSAEAAVPSTEQISAGMSRAHQLPSVASKLMTKDPGPPNQVNPLLRSAAGLDRREGIADADTLAAATTAADASWAPSLSVAATAQQPSTGPQAIAGAYRLETGQPRGTPAVQVTVTASNEPVETNRSLPKISLEKCPIENTIERNKRLIILSEKKSRTISHEEATNPPSGDQNLAPESVGSTTKVALVQRQPTPDSTDTEPTDAETSS